jgi:hypothetical protein
MIKKVICKMFGHKIQHAGFCPFTRIDYDVCTKCETMFEVKGQND